MIPALSWTAVDSLMAQAFAYDVDAATLYVRFTDAKVWRYQNVPSDVVLALQRAPSFGRSFQTLIRSRFTGERVDA